jgi:pimeloyl-ACP methyl ester carboxylesterase
MQHRSYLEELTSLQQPVTIVQGKADVNRIPQRKEYETEMKDCTLVTLPEGLNVLPWECPELFAETVQQQMKK